MSRLEVPLKYRTLWATGDLLLRGELDLLLKDRSGGWSQEAFLADSGAEITTMPAWLANTLDLPIPPKAAHGAVHTQTGLEIRSGYLRVQVVGMDGTEYVFPCFFLGDPTVPVPTAGGPIIPRKLLGLSGVINHLRISFDGKSGANAPYGHLLVEKT